MSAKDAVDQPKFHPYWHPDTVDIEKGFSELTAQQLKDMGYKLETWNAICRTELIRGSAWRHALKLLQIFAEMIA